MSLQASGIIEQSAAIPYRLKDNRIEVLLITSKRKKRWIVPKGMLELFMTPAESAAEEAWEEAGVIGDIAPQSIGFYQYEKWNSICRVEVFLLQVKTVLPTWPEAHLRTRKWVDFQEAARRVREADLKQLLLALPDMIGS